MNNLQGKRLLLLGSNLWKDNIKQFAKENGVYLIFTGSNPGPLDEIADEHYRIDSTDPSVMIPFIKEHKIDGVFMGGSELIISKSCDYINQLGYPCCCTKKQWEILQNKRSFKNCCIQYNVPTVPEFVECEVQESDFPVIVKPVDGCASKGINVCYSRDQYVDAVLKAKSASPAHKILIEKYIDNGGVTNVVNYVAIDGKYYLNAMGDRYVLNGGLITAVSFFPSKFLDLWMEKVDAAAKEMMSGLGIKNGVIAFQTIPDGDEIYTYECCFRLTGGMTYKMTDAVSGHNSFRLLLHHSLTGRMGNEDEISKINPTFDGKKGITMTIPLRTGTIGRIEGEDEIQSFNQVVDYTHYYEIGDSITPQKINTLDQLYARIMVVGESQEKLMNTLNEIRKKLIIEDVAGENMIIWDTFDKLYRELSSKY